MILQSNVLRIYPEVIEVMHVRAEAVSARTLMLRTLWDDAFQSSFSSEEEAPEPEQGDASLDDAAKGEREYVRRRLRDETGREPSEEEVDEWLRRHTEGY